MVGQIIATLRDSPLVKDIEVIRIVEEESVQYLRVRAEITDGSQLYVKELFLPNQSKYSYHWQTSRGRMLIRWDNAPHHPEVSTHPDHKHEGKRLVPSARVSVEDVLAELAAVVKNKGQIK